MIRGTRNIKEDEAWKFEMVTRTLTQIAQDYGYEPFYPSSLAEQEIFINKAGKEILNQMYTFKDKGNRDICLIPEVTALVQDIYNKEWINSRPKPIRLYYLTKCYRYDRPQAGRYREFWQFGIEFLGGKDPGDKKEVIKILEKCMSSIGPEEWILKDQVKRGLDYYVEDGFEVENPALGAQKQIAGGGRYKEGIGWAIGVDRLLL
jgi:histidyl-tRNA synthetase